MKRNIRIIIGLISSLMLFSFGVYRLLNPVADSSFVPAILAVGGFAGFIGYMIELRKNSS